MDADPSVPASRLWRRLSEQTAIIHGLQLQLAEATANGAGAFGFGGGGDGYSGSGSARPREQDELRHADVGEQQGRPVVGSGSAPQCLVTCVMIHCLVYRLRFVLTGKTNSCCARFGHLQVAVQCVWRCASS
jgi:hypothetical protein